VLLNSSVESIELKNVTVQLADKLMTIKNDAVIVCAGGVLPDSILKKSA
jgi:predicted flavoprotein YhiN